MGKVFTGSCYILLWAIWKWRNQIIHADGDDLERAKQFDVFTYTQRLSLLCISNWSPHLAVDWSGWIANPVSIISP